MSDDFKRYSIQVAGMLDLRVDAYLDFGTGVIEAVRIGKDGKTFDHISIPSMSAIIIDHRPPMSLDDFLEEERKNEERIENTRKARRKIQDMADADLESLPEKIKQFQEEQEKPQQVEELEGYR